MLASGVDGIKNQVSLGERIDENLFTRGSEFPDLPMLPTNLYEALDALKQNKLLMEMLGELGAKIVFEFKEKEWNAFSALVSDWEMEHYINI